MSRSLPSSGNVIAGLALAGFASGVLSVVSAELGSNISRLQELGFVLYVPGAIFGVMVSVYLAVFLRIRSWLRLLLFVAASIGAYFLAVLLSVFTAVTLRPWEGLSREFFFYIAMFLGGMAGALVIVTAAQLLFARRPPWKAILRAAILWALVGGVLGVVGWALGGSVGKLFWLALHAVGLTYTDIDLEGAVRTDTVNVFSLFVLWQTAMAPVVGWLISKSSAVQPKYQSTASA